MPTFNGTSASETLTGTAGDDVINEYTGGSDTLRGLDGADTLYISRSYDMAADVIRAEGGAGNDLFAYHVDNGSTVVLDGGDGDDVFRFREGMGQITVTTGAGADRIVFDQYLSDYTTGLRITDFTPGAGGDVLDLVDWLPAIRARLDGWDGDNPFATGHLVLVQVGADAQLRLRPNATGDGVLVATFANTAASSLTAANLLYSPDGVGGAPGVVINGSGQRIGTNGDDVITGAGAADSFSGAAGADQLNGAGGNDLLDGGLGDDVLRGGDGQDYLSDLDGGDDRLYGDAGDDQIRLYRNQVVDQIVAQGGDGADTFDVTLYNASSVQLDGGAGDDMLKARIEVGSDGTGEIVFTTGAGRDSVDINAFQTNHAAVTVTDFAAGAGGDRILWNDLLEQNLRGSWGGNPFASGHARLVQDGADVLLQIDFDGGGADGWRTAVVFRNTSAGAFTADNFEGYAPSGAPLPGQTLDGTANADGLTGGRGDDTINGLGGVDVLSGGFGHDKINGGDGDDNLDGGAGSDTLIGGLGDDMLDAGANGADVLDGGDGADRLYVSRTEFDAPQTVSVHGGGGADLIGMQLYNGASALVDGGAGDDVFQLSGRGGLITVTTGAGADVINFNKFHGAWMPNLTITDFEVGVDQFNWSAFLSELYMPFANPFLAGYARLIQDGADAVLQIDMDGGADDFALTVRFQNTQVSALNAGALGFQAGGFNHTGTNSWETFYGSIFADRLDGAANGDTLYGLGGDDTLIGGDGNDFLLGGVGDDLLDGGAGPDYASYADATAGVVVDVSLAVQDVGGGQGRDTFVSIENLMGSAYNDRLIGDGNVNILYGGAGDDVLESGLGADNVYGEGGDDVIRFTAVATGAATPITNLSGGAGTDTLDLSTLGAVSFANFTGTAFRLTLGSQRFNVSEMERILTGAGADRVVLGALSAGVDIRSGAGDDEIGGGWGDDLLNGGDGTDIAAFALPRDQYVISTVGGVTTVTGPTGTDVLTNIERLRFADGLHTLAGVPILATILGTSGADVLAGTVGDDGIDGDAGDDVITGGAGADRIDGGDGFDIAVFANPTAVVPVVVTTADGVVTVTGPDGYDTLRNIERIRVGDFELDLGTVTGPVYIGRPDDETLHAGSGDDRMYGRGGVDHLYGGAGNDWIDGGVGDDYLVGDDSGAGDDVLVGGQGNDALIGGGGNDTADYSAAAASMRAQLNAGAASNDGDGGTDTFTSIENLTGSAFNDTLIGDGNANVLKGGLGADTLLGLGGNDVLWGGTGAANTLQGGLGDDRYVVEASDSVIENAGEGTDTVDARVAAYTLSANVENLVFGGTGNFTGTGNSGNNTITGGAGNDNLRGRGGVDVLNGGQGSDTVDYTLAAAGVTARLDLNRATNDGDGATDTFTGIENLTGSNFNDLLIGDGGKNVLMGGIGTDTLLGFGGDDILMGGSGGGNNQLQGGQGNDWYVLDAFDTVVELAGEGVDTVEARVGSYTLAANVENLLYTGPGSFVGSGNALDNVITGGTQNDILKGGGGNDTINGGLGSDEVQFRGSKAQYTVTVEGSGYRIVDTVAGRDGSTLVSSVEVLRFLTGNTTTALSYPPVAPAALEPVDKHAGPLTSPIMDDQPVVLPTIHDKAFEDGPQVLPGPDDGKSELRALFALHNDLPAGPHALFIPPEPDLSTTDHRDWM